MKVLLIKTSALGDVIQCFSVLRCLHETFPNITVDWVVERAFSDLLKAHPFVRRVIPLNMKKWKKALMLQKTWVELNQSRRILRKETYDVIFDLQGNTKSGLITKLVKGKDKVGFTFSTAPEWPSSLFVSHRYTPDFEQSVPFQYLSLVQQYFSIKPKWFSSKISLEISKDEETWVENILKIAVAPRLMICLGSNWENKKLSLSTWQKFLEKVNLAYRPFFFFVWGTEIEKKEVERLQTHFSVISRVLPKMRLPLWQRFMQKMDGVVSVDSSALHLAATASIPSFSLFGPSSPEAYRPFGKEHHTFQGSCPYGRTFHKRCPVLRTCLTGACLKEISCESLEQSFKEWGDLYLGQKKEVRS